MNMQVGSVFGLLILVADVWAILNIVQSRAQTVHKLLWIVAVLLMPLLGLVIWWIAGPREGRR